MKRNFKNLQLYKETCKTVWDRAGGVCEILVDGERCKMFIPFEDVRAINFLHKETRNGKSDEWILDPDSIFLGCEEHHIEEERTGVRVQGVEYDDPDDIVYVPDIQ